MKTKPRKSPPTRSYSVRCVPTLWNGARQRAEHEGITINDAVKELLLMYSSGEVDLPRYVRVPPKSKA